MALKDFSTMIQLNCLRMGKASQIISKVKNYKYVSFDIFDTLLKRDVVNPKNVFDIIGRMHNDSSFAKLRVAAEAHLREVSNREEIGLDDIYDELGDKYSAYKDDELKVEKSLLTINPEIFKVYQYCKEHNKVIVIISDMYLPAAFLKDILHAKGIDYDYCFISSEVGSQKVTGNLFRSAIKSIGISPDEMIHIGDSIRGDYLGARKAYVSHVLIPKVIGYTDWIDLKNGHQRNNFNAFINNHIDTSQDQYYQLGYAYFGPVLFGFVKWLHDSIKDKKIFFFARDGYLVKKIYDALYPESQTDYIYLSRRALSVPLLWKHAEWEEFSNYITLTRFFTVKTFIKRLGLDLSDYEGVLTRYHLTPESVLKESTFLTNESLHAFYDYIKPDIIKNSRDEYDALALYFKSKHFSGDIAVMDIGWNGSMQRYLLEIMKMLHVDVKMSGYYFGMRKNIAGTEVHGYFYDKKHMSMEGRLSFMQGLFESLFLSHEGSTKRYQIADGQPAPVLYDPEYLPQDVEYKSFKSVQLGGYQFCLDYSSSLASEYYSYDAATYAYSLMRLGTKPTLGEIQLFGDFRFFDTNVVYLAKPEGLSSYLMNPRKFLKDFSYSVWKAGFLRKCFRVKAPYAGLYMLMKSVLK